MRLLHTQSLTLHEFIGKNVPPYAILSHTWEDEEVLYEHVVRDSTSAKTRKGWSKILKSCEKAAFDGWQWIWIDTCCIDKSSSAELSEAINSMFKWYQDARVCFAYLTDMDMRDSSVGIYEQFPSARWFTRGWTLQELLACQHVIFFDRQWQYISSKASLAEHISNITTIDKECLTNNQAFRKRSVAQKMSWAANRETTRTEDVAYCLMGLFEVSMPLLYGEGAKAFRRLQLEILKESSDQSIFSWNLVQRQGSGLLARSPRDFSYAKYIVKSDAAFVETRDYAMTNAGLRIELLLSEGQIDPSGKDIPNAFGNAENRSFRLAILNCQSTEGPKGNNVAILLTPVVTPKLRGRTGYDSGRRQDDEILVFCRWTLFQNGYEQFYAVPQTNSTTPNVFAIHEFYDGYRWTFQFLSATILVQDPPDGASSDISVPRNFLHTIRVPQELGPPFKLFYQRPRNHSEHTNSVENIATSNVQILIQAYFSSDLLRRTCALAYRFTCPIFKTKSMLLLIIRSTDSAEQNLKHRLFQVDDITSALQLLKPATAIEPPDTFPGDELHDQVVLDCDCMISCCLRPCGSARLDEVSKTSSARAFDLIITIHQSNGDDDIQAPACHQDISAYSMDKFGRIRQNVEKECFDAMDFYELPQTAGI